MKPLPHRARGSDDGRNLIDFLAARLGLSKRKAKDLLDQRNVLVNGRRVWMARHRLSSGDAVEILRQPASARPTPPGILFRDEHLVIANKPPGILSDGPQSLEADLRRSLGIPGLLAVHRLDRDTTGCLILACSEADKARMLPLFRDRRVAKTYHAIVVGRVTQRSHTLRRPIEGCDAVTHWRVLDSNAVASHLLVRIETGRTHQIRRHMEEIGHPVLGDRNYGTAEPLPAVLRAVPRQMLHAAGLRFARPVTGQRVRVDAPLPEDFTAWLKRLGLR